MPDQQTLLTVILAAISLNLVLALGILLLYRSRGRRGDVARSGARALSGVPAARPMVPLFAAPPHGQHQTDPQTGLELAATWDRWLVEEDARAKRYRRPATVVLVEIDGLDRLVERLGPAAAERLVPPVAVTMRRYARQADHIARLGRARFGAILVETDEVQAINYIERIRSAADLWLASGAVSLRLSIGWAEASGSRSMDEAADEADQRLNTERRRLPPVGGPTLSDGPVAEPAPG